MSPSPELVGRFRADLVALRDDIARLHELPEDDRASLQWGLLHLVQHALAAAGQASVSATEESRLMVLRLGGDAGSTEPDPPSLEQLVHHLSPALDIETPVEVLQARRNAEARALLLSEFGALTSSQVADLLGSEARNRSALPHRWRKERRLLAVVYRGAMWFPGFQFDESGVAPVLREVLDVLAGAGLGEWETALWFTAPNGWLDDRRPVDLLRDQPDRVVEAARFEGDDFGG